MFSLKVKPNMNFKLKILKNKKSFQNNLPMVSSRTHCHKSWSKMCCWSSSKQNINKENGGKRRLLEKPQMQGLHGQTWLFIADKVPVWYNPLFSTKQITRISSRKQTSEQHLSLAINTCIYCENVSGVVGYGWWPTLVLEFWVDVYWTKSKEGNHSVGLRWHVWSLMYKNHSSQIYWILCDITETDNDIIIEHNTATFCDGKYTNNTLVVWCLILIMAVYILIIKHITG